MYWLNAHTHTQYVDRILNVYGLKYYITNSLIKLFYSYKTSESRYISGLCESFNEADLWRADTHSHGLKCDPYQ